MPARTNTFYLAGGKVPCRVAEVLALKPDYPGMFGISLGVVGPWTAADGEGADFEVRAFIPSRARDAGLAQRLIGQCLSRTGHRGPRWPLHVQRGGDDVWMGGNTVTVVDGTIDLTGRELDRSRALRGLERRPSAAADGASEKVTNNAT